MLTAVSERITPPAYGDQENTARPYACANSARTDAGKCLVAVAFSALLIVKPRGSEEVREDK
jgi:hypothetical protein